jgi:hypothetical protein
MTVSEERLSAISAALKTIAPPSTTVTPSPAQITAGFITAKATIMALVKQLVPSWELPYVNISDSEIHAVSDAVTRTVVNTPSVTTAPPTAKAGA